MRPEYKTKTNSGVGIGLILQLPGVALVGKEGTAAILGLLLIVVGLVPFVWGCMNYAEGKGHSKWLGVLGLAGIIGLIVLILLPDQDRDGATARVELRKLVGVISVMVGLALVVLGDWIHNLGIDVRFDAPGGWCQLLGGCLALGSLLFLVGSIQSEKIVYPRRSPR